MADERQRLLAVTILAGGLCGLAAVAFHLSIGWLEALLINRANHAPGYWWIFLTILTPGVGGLIVGLGLTYWVPAAAGSGIPQVKVAFALRSGLVSLRETIGKFVLCAFQIGSGASLGLEGPTVQICAGVSSLLARAARLSPQNCRRMTSVGMAAGIAAAFNAPIAAITFTLEELIGDLDQTMLSGVIVAAALAAVVEHSILGSNPVFHMPRTYALGAASSLIWYALLGVLAAVVSITFTDSLLALRALFQAVDGGAEVDSSGDWRPGHGCAGGAGALLVSSEWHCRRSLQDAGTCTYGNDAGAVHGCFLRAQTCGDGQFVLQRRVWRHFCAVAVHGLDARRRGGLSRRHRSFIILPDAIGAFAVVGMGAVFAGIVRAPMTSILIVFEMTGGYGLVLPLMIANMTAFVLARYLRPVPIYEALLMQDGIELPDSRPLDPPRAAQIGSDEPTMDATA